MKTVQNLNITDVEFVLPNSCNSVIYSTFLDEEIQKMDERQKNIFLSGRFELNADNYMLFFLRGIKNTHHKLKALEFAFWLFQKGSIRVYGNLTCELITEYHKLLQEKERNA
ncbi:hypothetical protein [Mycoplasma sp. Ms02]|uniref:hypothetical protein n=1 Tax=Mycoplasma sp. Ms02 TaxID=353851 RepID=UPI001C8AF0E3|nr:hypothetical protein [Mycoplasma sp. Ms02]QZE12166.1 hypothetical protein K4L35_02360 [Mycoplasma sp. Ms02]